VGLRRPRVAARRVPQALRRAERRHDVRLVAAGQVVGATVERRPASPGHRLVVAHELLEPRIPPEDVARPHRRRLDPSPRRASLRQPERPLGVDALRLVRGDGPLRPERTSAHHGDRENGRDRPEPPRDAKQHEERGRGDARLERSDEEERPRRERAAGEKNRVDRTVDHFRLSG
jgi:hypothetical protein